MADIEQQQNQQKQKNNAPKGGLTMTTSVSAVNNTSLGETIRGSVCDSFGYMIGAIFTGVASWGLNRIISRFKPGAKTPPLFQESTESSGPSDKELMGLMHNLARTNPEQAKRILDSVGSRFPKPDEERPSVPALPLKELAPTAPKQDVPAPSVSQDKSKSKSKK